ncbi:hypothetical protein Tco_0078002 [Tanacetum coccineum]
MKNANPSSTLGSLSATPATTHTELTARTFCPRERVKELEDIKRGPYFKKPQYAISNTLDTPSYDEVPPKSKNDMPLRDKANPADIFTLATGMNAQNESNLSITSNDINIELNNEYFVELRKSAYHGWIDEDVVNHIAKLEVNTAKLKKLVLLAEVSTASRVSVVSRTVMSSASSAVTYTSVYTDSEPGRVFWGADEEISDGGSPRVIVLGYDGLPIQPVAPPSPDYIPGPEDPQTPPVPQDEDEREPMFIQPHDPDYVPEPIYPEYIPLEDEHVFPVEEQPLPPVVSPTAESPGYVIESDPEEDPEEYEDDETEDGPVDYPMDEGDDGDDDDGDSSGDDADDEEEEEEHLALTDSTVIVSTVEPVSPPEGTEHVIPPPSTDISTIGAKITVRLQASISLPPEAEVERLLVMPTPSPSPPISLSPPSVGERLARCTTPPTLSSPPPMPLPLLQSSGCLTQIQTLRMASTQALIDAVTAALPLPPLPPLPPSLYIPPPVDRMNDLPESEQPPRKRLCLSTLGSKYEGISEVGIRDTRVDPAEAVPKIAPMTVEEVNTRVIELAELHEHDTQDLYALLGDAQDRDSTHYGGGGLCFSRGLGSLDRIESGDPSGVSDPPLSCVCTRDPYPGTSGIATAAEYSHSDTSPDI